VVSSPVFPPDFSIVVVGAGPAGATAARTLALAGVRVRLLDRAVFPRNKPCGGGISTRVLARFPYIRRPLDDITTLYVSKLYLEGPGGKSALIASDEPAALMIRRLEFDALLVRLAAEAGAEVVSGVDVIQARQDDDRVTLISRDGRRFEAPIVIAADGVHSIVARRLGLNPGWSASAVALDMMEETPRTQLRDVDPTALWVAYGYEPRGRAEGKGYAYIFPKRDHVNIGIGYVLEHFRNEIDAAPYALQRDFVDHLRARGIVEGDSVRKNFTPFLLPVGGPLKHPGRGRVLLAGDAGGFVNAFTAEGIYYAMVSGDLAARAIVSGGAEKVAARYRRACNNEIGAELRDSVRIQQFLFADSRRIAQVIDAAPREGAMTRVMLELATGRRSYKSTRWQVLGRSPALAARFVWDYLTERR
jgi:geranylgeranyl reductase family protein